MRLSISLLTLSLVGGAAVQSPLAGQTAHHDYATLATARTFELTHSSTAAVRPGIMAVNTNVLPLPVRTAQVSLTRRVFSALGAAAVGAGIGYFASQVVRGDWDDMGHSVDRPVWAAVGGSIGFTLGLAVPLPSRPVAPPPAQSRGLRGDRFTILSGEIQGRGALNAYDAIRALRPEWLNNRGAHVLGESAQDRIQVYMDDVLLGGINSLRQVRADVVASFHFLDAASASARWGAGNSHGAILIIMN